MLAWAIAGWMRDVSAAIATMPGNLPFLDKNSSQLLAKGSGTMSPG